MPDNSMIYLFLGGGFFVGVFISVLLFISSVKHRKSDLFLGFIVLFFAVNLIHPHLNRILGDNWKLNSYRLFEPNQYLIFPLLFIYIRNYLSSSIIFKPKDLLHLIPFAFIIPLSFTNGMKALETLTPVPVSSLVFWAAMMIQSLIYLRACSIRITQVHATLAQNYSNLKGLKLDWLRWLIRFFILINILYFIPIVFLVHSGNTHLIRAVVSLIISLIIWTLGIRIVFGGINVRQAVPPADKKNSAPAKDRAMPEIAAAVTVLLEDQRLFTNPDLDLDELVRKSGFSRNEISAYFNNSLNKNFYQVINELRVSEVIRLMKDSAYANYKLISIAFDAGFNSKPTFNKIFKQMTGSTPSEFRKNLKS